jgi:hypothetical protein
MYILSHGTISKKEWLSREKRYARHLSRIKDRFDPNFFSWFERNKLHDANLVKINFDDLKKEVSIKFEYIGLWPKVGSVYIKPKTQHLTFLFSGVSDFSVKGAHKNAISLTRTDFLVAELNTHPYLKKHKKMNSIVMSMCSTDGFEIIVLFAASKLREGK